MKVFLSALTAALLIATTAFAADIYGTQKLDIRVETLADGLDHPWGMTELPDRSILVTERSGRLLRLTPDGERSEVSNVPEVANVGQGGLLDIEADEDFESNRRVYFTWSEPGDGGYSTALSTAVLSEDYGRLTDVEKLFAMEKKTGTGRHFGSRVVLAPDNKLFMTMGDRGERDRAQDMSDHAGSVVRLNRDGTVPADNPYVDKPGAKPELWSKGHRNPQGATWDRANNRLWTVEHGARGGDEINLPEAGKNYGWPVVSYGRHYSGAEIGQGTSAPGYEQPVYYWDPSIAPSGLAIYDADLIPQWRGDLLAGALKYQMLVRLEMEDGVVTGEERMLQGEFGRIRDVAVFSDGAVYLLTDESNGKLLRITPAGEK